MGPSVRMYELSQIRVISIGTYIAPSQAKKRNLFLHCFCWFPSLCDVEMLFMEFMIANNITFGCLNRSFNPNPNKWGVLNTFIPSAGSIRKVFEYWNYYSIFEYRISVSVFEYCYSKVFFEYHPYSHTPWSPYSPSYGGWGAGGGPAQFPKNAKKQWPQLPPPQEIRPGQRATL